MRRAPLVWHPFAAIHGVMGIGLLVGYIVTLLFWNFFLLSLVYVYRAIKVQSFNSVFTDNEALVHVINKQSCHDKTLMIFVCKLLHVCLDNILFKAKHIPGVKNKLADCLSCF